MRLDNSSANYWAAEASMVNYRRCREELVALTGGRKSGYLINLAQPTRYSLQDYLDVFISVGSTVIWTLLS